MVGQTLGHYRILEKIGEGGMGVVFRARDERLERDVALKVLPAGTLVDEQARKRFHKEALALSKLNHPNIETVHDFDTQEGVDFLVMEYIPGVTLSDKLAGGPLPEKEILRLGTQLAEGLAAAHEQGVVHRDLKPGNLRITPDGRLKILDFGLAKLLRPASEVVTAESLTETLALAGTLPYMAPEQLQGEKVDARADLYATGNVLYEMATGRRPFVQRLASALIADIVHTPPPPPRQFNPRVSSRLEEIILKCLEKEPENRYQSSKELGVDLRRLATPSAPVPAARGRRPGRRYALVGAGLGVGVLLAAVLVGLNVGGLRERLLGRAGPPKIQSLAVLPLENLSRDPDQDYFVDGMTEALTTELSRISALKVISRTSAMQYKGVRKAAPQIARELGVDALIEGSVQREGDQVRVTVQLIHGPSDQHLWAESYQREVRGILALQSEVARDIAEGIQLKLTPQQQTRLATTRQVNPAAYEAYLKGRYHVEQWSDRETLLARDYYQQAIRLDPNYALPYIGLAETYMWILPDLPPREGMAKARPLVQKALELDPTLGEAHAALAQFKFLNEWDWSGSEQEFKRALELNPNYAEAHHMYSHLLLALRRNQESLAESQRALALDPRSPGMTVHMAVHYTATRQYDQAIQQYRKALELDPNFPDAHQELGLVLCHRGMPGEALAELEKAVALRGDTDDTLSLGYVYARLGRRHDAQNILQRLKEQSKKRFVSSYFIALIYTGLGEKEQAFQWLEKAYQERDVSLTELNREPGFDPLHSHPRFQDLLRRIGLPP